MIQKILILIALELILLLLLSFTIFSAFHYLKDKDDKAERIFLFVVAGFCFIFMIVCGIGIMTC